MLGAKALLVTQLATAVFLTAVVASVGLVGVKFRGCQWAHGMLRPANISKSFFGLAVTLVWNPVKPRRRGLKQ